MLNTPVKNNYERDQEVEQFGEEPISPVFAPIKKKMKIAWEEALTNSQAQKPNNNSLESSRTIQAFLTYEVFLKKFEKQ